MHMLLCSCTGFATMHFCVCQIHDDFHFRLFAATHASADQLCHSGDAGGTGNTLMGLVDTAVLGRLGSPVALAAVAVGGSIFTVLYWCSAFCVLPPRDWWRRLPGSSPDAVVLAGLRPMLAALWVGWACCCCSSLCCGWPCICWHRR
jgi:hypothetical protein